LNNPVMSSSRLDQWTLKVWVPHTDNLQHGITRWLLVADQSPSETVDVQCSHTNSKYCIQK